MIINSSISTQIKQAGEVNFTHKLSSKLLDLSKKELRSWDGSIHAVEKMGWKNKQCAIADNVSGQAKYSGSVDGEVWDTASQLLIFGIAKKCSADDLLLNYAIKLR